MCFKLFLIEHWGVVRGGIGPWPPPLGRQDSIISIDSMPNCVMPPHPPFVSYAEALSTQRVGEVVCFWPAPNFGQIMGLNLSEDLFFFLLFT